MININFAKLTEKYQDKLISNLRDFVKINSTYDEKTVSETNPFGKGVSDALNYFASLAKADGLQVINYDNKVVEAIFGEGDKNITIMAHADVVPEGDNWSQDDPYVMEERKNILYGRGVADDKGPCLAAYYALIALKDNQLLSNNYRVRFLVGGNEERGSACMYHYFHTLKKEQPTIGFTPDSSFPLIYGEKGMVDFEAHKTVKVKGLISLSGGEAFNSVIADCEVKMELDDDIIPFLIQNYPEAQVVTKDDIVTIHFIGKSAHGSIPQYGINAGLMAIDFLAKYTKNIDMIRTYEFFSDPYGKGLNAFAESKNMGKNSMNVGFISIIDNKLSVSVNLRFVETANPEELHRNIKAALEKYTVKFDEDVPLLYFDKTSPIVKTLLKAYISETGKIGAKPLTTGGGTYAKEAENVVAFGAEFPGWDANMHTADEKIKKSDLFLSMQIYAKAIYELGKLIDAHKI